MDISNGEGIGVSLFVQGCHFNCYNCFNSETWNFNEGYEWTKETKSQFLKLVSKPFVKRVSILGGEPLADENLEDVLVLVKELHNLFPDKSIWLYSGYVWEDIWNEPTIIIDELTNYRTRQKILDNVDVLVDGKYIDSQRDLTLKWRGSKNQRVIDVRESFQKGEIVLWTT